MKWLIIFVHCKNHFLSEKKSNFYFIYFYSNRYDESVFDNPELPESNDHDFEWNPSNIDQEQPESEKDLSNKLETTPPPVTKTRKRPTSPASLTPSNDAGRRSGRQKLNPQTKDDDEPQQTKVDKRKSIKDSPRISTRSVPNNNSIGTRLRGQK